MTECPTKSVHKVVKANLINIDLMLPISDIGYE